MKWLYILLVAGWLATQAGPALANEMDTDGDGLSDKIETALGSNPTYSDTDHDGFDDAAEVYSGHNPLAGNKDRSLSRKAVVDLTTQQLHYYLNGVKIGSMPVSTGLIKWATPVGEFKVLRKKPVVHYRGAGYDYPNTKWNLEFKPHIYLHGAYWHNQFGKRPMSRGCVNIAYKNAGKLYAFLDVGDTVEVVGKTPTRVVNKR